MAAHWIGIKKVKSFANKSGLDFVAGLHNIGKEYIMMCSNETLYVYNKAQNTYKEFTEENQDYAIYLRSMKARVLFLENNEGQT